MAVDDSGTPTRRQKSLAYVTLFDFFAKKMSSEFDGGWGSGVVVGRRGMFSRSYRRQLLTIIDKCEGHFPQHHEG